MRNGVIILLVVAGFLFSGFFVVDQREVAVVYTTPTKMQIFAPGIHWHLPLSSKLNYVYTNLQSSYLGLELPLAQNQQRQLMGLKVVINYQVTAAATFFDYLKNASTQQFDGELGQAVIHSLSRVAEQAKSARQFEELVNSQLRNLKLDKLGVTIVNLGLISLAPVTSATIESASLAVTASSSPLALESAFNLAHQIKLEADKLQQQRLAKLRSQDTKFFDYFLQIDHYRHSARTAHDVPPLDKLFSKGN